jgi:hypothetical protein
VLAAAVVSAVIWVRRRPRRVYAAGLMLLAPLALAPAWTPRDLVWPAVFGYLGDARWASIYAVAAGATRLRTATWWGTGIPWDAGVDPATVPAGSVAGLGLVTWVVLCSWQFLGWRTVAVESQAATAGSAATAGPGLPRPGPQPRPGRGPAAAGSGGCGQPAAPSARRRLRSPTGGPDHGGSG